MENKELSVFSVENALMIISCKTTNIDDKEEVFENNFPFTFRDGQLLCFEVAPDEVDADFDMSEYDEVFRGNYNLEKYSNLKAFANAVLNREGKEYVKALYFDEELVIDNKFTFTLFNEAREAVFTFSKVVKAELPKPIAQEEEVEERDTVTMSRSLERTLEIHDDKFRRDRRVVLFHLFVLVAVTVLVWWMGDSAGWTSLGKWLVSITSGLYFAQWLWSNVPHEHLGVFECDKRRAKGRPWINGGFIIGLLLTLVNVVYYAYNPPLESFAYYYLMWWFFTMLITVIWGGVALCHRAMNKSIVDSMREHLGIAKNVRRVGRKQFIRSFFLAMLPIDWEIKIRNRHIERLDREEQEYEDNES